MSQSRIVVITGMHRSGTSLLGSILQALGIDLGSKLIAADRNNQAGYFENADIVRVHAELLELLDRRWVGRKGTLEYPPNWWKKPEVKVIQEKLTQIVRQEIKSSTSVWGFKDPRVCRLLPLWKAIFRQLDLLPIYYLSVRNPAAVSRSIGVRDELSTAQAQLLWLRHNLEAIRECRGGVLIVTEYERWFTGPQLQIRQTMNNLEANGIHVQRALATQALSRINSGLRHHQEHSKPKLPFVDELYSCLHHASVKGDIPERIYEIDRAFRRGESIFQNWAEIIDGLPRELPPKPPAHRELDPLFSRMRRWVRSRR